MALPSSCVANSTYTSCPAGLGLTIAGDQMRLNAMLTCPNEFAVGLDDFREATQKGMCECTETFLLPGEIPMNCECYGCPEGSMFAAAYICDSPIVSSCHSLNCAGGCNGTIEFEAFLPPATVLPAPTDAPVEPPSLAPVVASTTTPSSVEMESSEGPDAAEETDAVCTVEENHHICQADTNFDSEGWRAFLQGQLLCPIEEVDILDGGIEEASYRGLCTCQIDLLLIGRSQIDEEPIDCECFKCPVGATLGFAYSCDRPIVSDCSVINCNGDCNGPLDHLVVEAPENEGNDLSMASRSSGFFGTGLFLLMLVSGHHLR